MTPFEQRKDHAWTQVYNEYWERFASLEGPGYMSRQAAATFRQAVQLTTSMFTDCSNDLELADALFQMRETLELKLRTLQEVQGERG